jgi:hypothetical protein
MFNFCMGALFGFFSAAVIFFVMGSMRMASISDDQEEAAALEEAEGFRQRERSTNKRSVHN